MPAPRPARIVSLLACAGLAAGACAQRAHKAADTPWQQASESLQAFTAQTAHTRADYTRVLNQLRSVYHANPADPHAADAVFEVAHLLGNEGEELHDPASSAGACGQLAFLVREYPSSGVAHKVIADHMLCTAAPATAARTHAPSTSPDAPVKMAAHIPTVSPSEDATPATARVTGIRHWSTPTYTRVAIDLGDEISYQAARVENPDRIFFDLHHAHLAPELAGKSFAVTDDGFLTEIRAAQYTPDVTRVVLDVHEVADYSAFLLPNPYRLIIDIHGKPKDPGAPSLTASPSRVGPHEPQPDPTATSQLPPMPVTDGSASFGLPEKSTTLAHTAATPPRVVISTRPTAARPVPNTVTSRDASSTADVAAVSDQPGKIEATRHPTSAPIATTRVATTKTPRTKPHAAQAEDAAPTAPAPPTADGETLLRTLGLKIGRIVIDAGHGGHDSGTLGAGGIQEKDVVLDVALRLGKLLHQRLGAEIVYTRADDTFIPLETRTAIANKAQADLFISIHANSSQDPTARGVEVYYLNFTSDPEAMQVAGRENAVSTQSVHELSDLVKKIALKDKLDESHELATDVDTALYTGLTRGPADLTRTNATLKNRGVKKAPFVVLIGANMPSILAEISFVTNPDDAAQLRTPDYRERVAESLFAGVAKYASTINGAKSRTMLARSGQ